MTWNEIRAEITAHPIAVFLGIPVVTAILYAALWLGCAADNVVRMG